MSIMYAKYSKEDIEYLIKEKFKYACEDSYVKGYISTNSALETILYFAFVEEGWNEKLNCPATNFTNNEYYGFRYHIYNSIKQEVIYNPLTKNQALEKCMLILKRMENQKIIEFSKSKKAIKYIG